MANKFFEYCKQYVVPREEKEQYNFQFQPGAKDPGKKLFVPKDKYSEFFHQYYEHKVKAKQDSTLLERPLPEFNVMKIDLDFRFKPSKQDLINENEIVHKYKLEDIETFIKLYFETANKYLNLSDKYEVSIMEKKKCRLIKQNGDCKIIKDGIHIIFPFIVANNSILHTIRNEFIKNNTVNKIFNKFNNIESIDKCVDTSIISTNAWYPLGSGKPDANGDYYKITNTYNIDMKKTKINFIKTKLEKISKTLIMKYCNVNKKNNIPLRDDVDIEELNSSLNKCKKSNVKISYADKLIVEKSRQHKNKNRTMPSIAYFESLLTCLSQDRVDGYQTWFNVGFCLFNISTQLFDTWVNWSKKCKNKFDFDACEYTWYNTFYKNQEKYENLNLDQLKSYARKDNNEKFNSIELENTTIFLEKIVNEFLRPINNKNGKISIGAATFAQKLFDYINNCCNWKVICADPNTHTWYKFVKNVWEEDKGANQVKTMIINHLKELFDRMHSKYQSDINYGQINISKMEMNNNGMADFKRTEEKAKMEIQQQVINSKIKVTAAVKHFLESKSNRSNLINDLENLFYDQRFYENLDQNPNVFICSNCVLDFKNKEIREGLSTDMNSINSGLVFPDETNSMDAQEILLDIEDFLDKIFPISEIQDYVLNLLAESLCGQVNREEFFIHTGSGSNGKSVFSDLVSKVFGNYYYAPPNEIFNTPKGDPNSPNPIIANVKGKRYTMVSEPKMDKPLQSDIIKQYSGCDYVTGRHLNKEPITFKPQCKWNMACNDIPEMDSTDEGIWRRIKVIKYVAKFVSPDDYRLRGKQNGPNGKFPFHYAKDPSLKEKLNFWAPYFLSMLWRRYLNMSKVNFNVFNDDNIPDEVKKATRDYKKDSNIYEQFFDSKIESRQGYRQNVNEVFGEFKRYNQDNDYNKKVNKGTFITQMQRFVGKPRTFGREKYFIDFTITDSGEEY